MSVPLANESALGIFRFSWRSKSGDARCDIQWGAGMGNPLASMNGRAADVRNPERFGFKRPVTLKSFRAFVQAFADEFESGED